MVKQNTVFAFQHHAVHFSELSQKTRDLKVLGSTNLNARQRGQNQDLFSGGQRKEQKQ